MQILCQLCNLLLILQVTDGNISNNFSTSCHFLDSLSFTNCTEYAVGLPGLTHHEYLLPYDNVSMDQRVAFTLMYSNDFCQDIEEVNITGTQ